MRRLVLLSAAVFLGAWLAYLPTLNPAFRADDSPETAAACVTLGIQHPPGYPLHTLAGRVFSLNPLGAPCLRLNLMAAFFGALACALLTPLAALAGAPGAGAALPGLLLAFSKTHWSQSLAAKGGIYTFQAALLSLLLLSLVWWQAQVRRRLSQPLASRLELLGLPGFTLSAFVLTIGFGNHWETQALVLPAVLAFGWALWKQAVPDPKAKPDQELAGRLVLAGLLCAGALSVYLYLPLRARLAPALNWGDPKDWQQFWWVLLRQEYLDLETGFLKALRAALLGGGPWHAVAEAWPTVSRQAQRVLAHLAGLNADLSLPGAALGALGLWRLWKAGPAQRPLFAFLGVLSASFLFVITFYFHLRPEMVWILDVFLLPVYLALALASVWGLQWALGPGAWQERGMAIAAGIILASATLYTTRATRLSQATHYLAWDYGQDFLRSLKPRAVVFAEGDFNTMPIYYLQRVAGFRPDVDHLTTVFLSTDWGVANAKRHHPSLGIGEVGRMQTGARAGDAQVMKAAIAQVAQAAWGKRPLQASLFRQVQAENIPQWEPLFMPSGLAPELGAPDSPSEDRRRAGLLKAFSTRHLSLDRAHLEPSPEFALSNYGTAFLDYANALVKKGRHKEALPLYALACRYTSRANLAEAYTHWGIALAGGGTDGKHPDLEGAAAKFKQALEVKPLYEALANLAGVYNQLQRYLEAEPFARQALALQPNSGQSWNNLAVSLYGQKRSAEALQMLETALRVAPGDPQIQANLKALRGH